MPFEDTKHVWEQLDRDRKGSIRLETLLKWLGDYAHWAVGPEESGKVYRALAGRDPDLVITKALWYKNMSDYLFPEKEEPEKKNKEDVSDIGP